MLQTSYVSVSFLKNSIYVSLSVYATCVHMSKEAKGGKGSTELELQVVVNFLLRVLGTELRSFGRAHLGVISSAPI